jgi:outer membrane protein
VTAQPKTVPCAAAALAAILSAGCFWSVREFDAAVAAAAPKTEESRARLAGVRLDGLAATNAPAEPGGALAIGVDEAILLALENNRGLGVERLGVAKRSTYEAELAASFDPKLTASTAQSKGRSSITGLDVTDESNRLGVSMTLPTGTTFSAAVSSGHTDLSTASTTDDASYGVGISQPLLRNARPAANLAAVRQAALDVQSTEYELRGFVESLVARVESAYWDFALAERQIGIYKESLRLAETQLVETQERIAVGRLAETELAAARAEVASRREALIVANGSLATARIRLLRLMNPGPGGGSDAYWSREVTLRDSPEAVGDVLADVSVHVEHALALRSDLNQARLAVLRGELETVRTRNGLLPRLDAFVNLGRTGYANSFQDAVEDIDDGTRDVEVGLSFEWTMGRRSARAQHRRAEISREEAQLALDNAAQLIQVDVRTAHIAATTSHEQMAATAATRALKEESLRAETEKFRVGKSTTFLVARAQSDLVASQISEVQARVGYLKAMVDLFRLDASLLVRRGVTAPGRERP